MIKATLKYLQQTKTYLETISTADYTQEIPQLSNGTIGRHTRHFLECYQCLLEQHTSGIICYDLRARDVHLEENPRVALTILHDILKKIKLLDPTKPIILNTCLPTKQVISSSLNRELLHNYEHTTHHLALIRVGLILLGSAAIIPENFGLANATIQHQGKVVLND